MRIRVPTTLSLPYTNTYEEWCPNSNLFDDESAAQKCHADRKIAGMVLTLPRASELATNEWASLVHPQRTGSRTGPVIMPTTDVDRPGASRPRQIGAVGTLARVLLGLIFLVFGLVGAKVVVSHGQLETGSNPLSVALGLFVLPAALLGWQWLRGRRDPTRFQATGALATTVNMAIVFALLLTPWYAPALSFTSGAAFLFYGASMLLAAVRGYAGCEVLAVSNWVLRLDDQVGCMVLSPIDHLERSRVL